MTLTARYLPAVRQCVSRVDLPACFERGIELVAQCCSNRFDERCEPALQPVGSPGRAGAEQKRCDRRLTVERRHGCQALDGNPELQDVALRQSRLQVVADQMLERSHDVLYGFEEDVRSSLSDECELQLGDDVISRVRDAASTLTSSDALDEVAQVLGMTAG